MKNTDKQIKSIKPNLGYYIFFGLARLFSPKDEYIWLTDKPKDDEPIFFVSNHTKIYAPISFILKFEKKGLHTWTNYYFLSFKNLWGHLFNKVIKDRKPKFLYYSLAFLCVPLILFVFRCFKSIPVYHKCKDVYDITFRKSIEVWEAGLPQIIFPERTENPVNEYIFQFNKGFPNVAKLYYEETGKIMKFHPVYTCQSLHKVLIGEPIAFNPDEDFEKESLRIRTYLENSVKTLADTLPPHKIVFYG